MNETSTETRAVIVEREIPYPPEKIWRALTQPHLIEEWLMKNDFKPVVGHRFSLRGGLGRCSTVEVLAIEPNKTLSYTWDFSRRRPRSRASSPLRSPRRARGLTCAWSNRVSGRISSRPTRAPTSGGRNSLQIWSRCWRV